MINLFFVDEFGEKFPAWDSATLGDVCEVIGGGTPDTSNDNFWNGEINWFSPSEISKAGKYVSSSVRKISIDGFKSSSAKMLPKNSILLTTRASIGYMAINLEECCTNQGFQSLVVDENKADFNFIYYLREHIKKELDKKASGSTFAEISGKEVRKIGIPLPSLPEQKKIAEFFSALDERIALTADKVKLLKEQKQGYLQQVFARELVFTDENGERYPEWEEKKLGDVTSIKMGQSPDGKSYTEDSSQMVLIQGNADMKKGYIVPRMYTSEPSKTCEVGDIIMSVRAPVGAFAKTDIKACIGRGVCAITANDYIYQYLKYHSSIGGWSKASQGSTFESVNSTDIKAVVIPFPSLPEQEKIAEFFSALDEQIELTENKLELLKEQKKGYLQGIFG